MTLKAISEREVKFFVGCHEPKWVVGEKNALKLRLFSYWRELIHEMCHDGSYLLVII